MRRARLAAALLGSLTLLVGVPALGQAEPSLEIAEVNTSRYPRVTMVVQLRNVSELDTSRFAVTENGAPVSDLTVGGTGSEAQQVGIVLAVDTSGSMEGEPIAAARQAAESFVVQMRSQDRVAVLGFGDEVRVFAPFTNSRQLLAAALGQLEAEGATALYDAVVRAAEMYSGEAAGLERNLIVLSDGVDNGSTATLADAESAVVELGVRVFGVGLASEDFDAGPLRRLVEATGGVYLETSDPAELRELYGQIQRELENRVVLRFGAATEVAGPVEFAVQYGGLSAASTVEVPGFAPGTAGAGGAGELQVTRITSRAPVDITSLLALSVGATALAVVLLIFILGGPSRESGAGLRDRLQAYAKAGRGSVVEEKAGLLARIPLLRRFSDQAEAVAKRRGILNAMNAALEQADIPLRPGEALAGALGLAVVAGVITGLATGSALIGVLALGGGVILVFAVIQWVGSKEKRKFENQLPDTLTLIATSLRAGYSLLQAVEAVAEEAPNPTSREFARAIAEARLGRPVVEALQAMAERMQSQDFGWAVMAVEIQREVGGNLAEVLSIVADTMRQRNRLKGEIKALTAEGRISAFVLAALPFALFLFLWTSNREYVEVLFQRTLGLVALGVGGLLIGAGIVWMKKIVDIEV